MLVAHVITKGDVGGAQTHVVELGAAQIAAGLDVRVIVGTDGPAMDRLRRQGAEIVVVPSIVRARVSLRLSAPVRDVRAALSDIAPDIVHGHSSHAGLIARIAARQEHLASVYTAHGWPFQRGAAWPQRLVSFAGELIGGRLGNAVICLTEDERRRALRAHVVPSSRLWVVPNGIRDVPVDLRRRFDPDRCPSLVMVARFAPPKQQSQLIEALASMTDVDWRFSFVGDGPDLARCRALGRSLLGDRVRFLGHRDDVESILADHDIFVLWSDYEGLPISMLEAMRAGLCCVGSDLAGIRSLLAADVGVVARSRDELERTLRSLVSAPSSLRGYGELARRRYESTYSATAMEAATRSVYEAILEQRTADAAGVRNRGGRRRRTNAPGTT